MVEISRDVLIFAFTFRGRLNARGIKNEVQSSKRKTHPQMPLTASMLKLAACEGNMAQVE